MPSTTGFEFGDVVLVSFPFTNQVGQKKRPAVVVSSRTYNQQRPDLVLMAVTGQVRSPPRFGEIAISDWQSAGLLKPSSIKPVVFTVEKSLILRTLGRLVTTDREALKNALHGIIG
jgi:mRNA interferase MazF